MDIKIKEIEYNKTDGLSYSNLKLLLYGRDISNIIVNSIRRTIMEDIPTYAFSPKLFIIEKNTTIFNNDQIKLRLSQLPILNIDTGIDFLEEIFWNEDKYKVLSIHNNEKKISISINEKNTQMPVKNITTNDIKYYINDKQVKNPYNNTFPILITKLREGEEFICSMQGRIGIAKKNAIWSAASNVYFTIDGNNGDNGDNGDNGNNITLNIFSAGQIDEYAILLKACKNIIQQIDINKRILLNILHDNVSNKAENKEIEFKLNNKTIGSLLNERLQKHEHVIFSGMCIPTYLTDEVIIKTTFKENIKIINVISEISDTCIEVFNKIIDIISKNISTGTSKK